jgi:hypothetical protein
MGGPGVPAPGAEPRPPWITTPPDGSSPLLRPPVPRPPTAQGAGGRTASANPDKLDDAAVAVAPDLRAGRTSGGWSGPPRARQASSRPLVGGERVEGSRQAGERPAHGRAPCPGQLLRRLSDSRACAPPTRSGSLSTRTVTDAPPEIVPSSRPTSRRSSPPSSSGWRPGSRTPPQPGPGRGTTCPSSSAPRRTTTARPPLTSGPQCPDAKCDDPSDSAVAWRAWPAEGS